MGDNEYVGAIGAPFAITVIGGLSLSTLLTLVFIPTFYLGLETTLQWMRDLNWKLKIVQEFSWLQASCSSTTVRCPALANT